MNLLIFDEETIPEELDGLGSYNHSYIQTELGWKLRQAGDFTILHELSWDVKSLQDEALRAQFKLELKPDLSVYDSRPKPDFHEDVLRMEEMPRLVIEVLSPMQSYHVLERKLKAYFALGVESCWVVLPMVKTITIYKSPKESTTYNVGQVAVDDQLGIKLPLSEIF